MQKSKQNGFGVALSSKKASSLCVLCVFSVCAFSLLYVLFSLCPVSKFSFYFVELFKTYRASRSIAKTGLFLSYVFILAVCGKALRDPFG